MLTSTMIDWVTAHMKIPDLPVINDGTLLEINPDGSITRETHRWKRVNGSHVDDLAIRTIDTMENGRLLSVSGNPVKVLQGHNLAGTTKLFALLKRLYDVLRSEGPDLELPPRPSEIEFDLRRLDITRMFYPVTETENGTRAFILANDIINHYERNARTRAGKGLLRGKTLYFGNAKTRYWKGKMYAKGAELDAHPPKDLRLKLKHGKDLRDYAEPLIRCEIQLNDKTIDQIDACDFIDCEPLFDRFWDRIEVVGMSQIEQTRDNISKLPTQYRCTYYDWVNGVDLKAEMTHNTFYRHRRFLLRALDIDISIPQRKKNRDRLTVLDVRKFALVPAEPPAWLQEISFDPDAQKEGGFLRG